MNRLLAHVALPALAALTVVGCSAPAGTGPTGSTSPAGTGTLTITHQQGTTEVPANPARIVVLDHATLDTLDSLDLEDRVVGAAEATLPASLDEYADTPRVGTAQEPDLEAIAKLAPDAIIISARSSAKYAELNEVAPTIDLTVDNARPIESLTTNARVIGDLFDRRAEVDEDLTELAAEIEATKKLVPTDTTALIVLTSGGKVSAFGPGARFGSLIHDVLGVPAAATDLEASQHGQAISFEFIAETNPGALFVIDRDAAIGQQGASAQQVLDNPLVARTRAWQDGKVTYLDGSDWYLVGFGLDSTERMVEAVRAALA